MLIIKNASKEDSGNYECIVESRIGKDRRNQQLIVIDAGQKIYKL